MKKVSRLKLRVVVFQPHGFPPAFLLSHCAAPIGDARYCTIEWYIVK
jgi:hypothetical protein